MSEERTAFEHWAETEWAIDTTRCENGIYYSSRTQIAWEAWERSMNRAEIERLRAENADLKLSVITFCALEAVHAMARAGGIRG